MNEAERVMLADVARKVCHIHQILTGNGHPQEGIVMRTAMLEERVGEINKERSSIKGAMFASILAILGVVGTWVSSWLTSSKHP